MLVQPQVDRSYVCAEQKHAHTPPPEMCTYHEEVQVEP